MAPSIHHSFLLFVFNFNFHHFHRNRFVVFEPITIENSFVTRFVKKKKQRKSNSSESFVFEWQPCIALIYLFIFDVIIFNWEFGFDSIISFVVQKETKEQIESFVFKWQHCIALISLFFFSFDDIIFDWEFGSTSHPATPWASFFLFCSLFLSLFIFSISLFHFFIGRCRGREWDVIKKWKKNF